MKNATFCIGEKKILDSINMTARQGQHIAIVGTVGSGKSRYFKSSRIYLSPVPNTDTNHFTSLMNAILGEIGLNSGKMKVGGKIAYVSQEAWIQQASGILNHKALSRR